MDRPLSCGCNARYYALGMCARHYRESRRRKEGLPKRRCKNVSGCSELGCSRPYHARGLCQLHYQQLKRTLVMQPIPYFRNPLVPQIEELAVTMRQAKIAELLKISRNIVIGVVDRARLAGRLPGLKTEARRKTHDEPAETQGEVQFWRRIMSTPDYVPPREFPPPGFCRWMNGDPLDPVAHFCGEAGDPWCNHHRAIVYVRRLLERDEFADAAE